MFWQLSHTLKLQTTGQAGPCRTDVTRTLKQPLTFLMREKHLRMYTDMHHNYFPTVRKNWVQDISAIFYLAIFILHEGFGFYQLYSFSF